MLRRITVIGLSMQVMFAACFLYFYSAINHDSKSKVIQRVSADQKTEILMQDAPETVTVQAAVILSRAKISYKNDKGAVNASIAAEAINGTKIEPGEIFSFNSVVGPRTEARGYVEGTSIMRTENGIEFVPDIGGGVCRTATALHKAVRLAGLKIIEHHHHSLPVEYALDGQDAAVAWPNLGYKFQNNRNKEIVIKAIAGEDYCEIEIWELFL